MALIATTISLFGVQAAYLVRPFCLDNQAVRRGKVCLVCGHVTARHVEHATNGLQSIREVNLRTTMRSGCF